MILPRLARSHTADLGATPGPLRLAVVGTAGSGKTMLLRSLARRLGERGHEVVVATTPEAVAASGETVVIVDDAHLHEPAVREALTARISDPHASVVLATRPWPLHPELEAILAHVERSQPAVVLGNLSSVDVAIHLDENGRIMERRCLDGILDMTGHLSWLTAEALAIHDDLTCEGGSHAEIEEGLRELIAHRLDTLDPETRSAIVSACLASSAGTDADATSSLAGYAKGLLLRNGRPAPVVRLAVRSTVPVDRLVEEYVTTLGLAGDRRLRHLTDGVRDPRLAAALLLDGDDALTKEPARAAELYRRAEEAGADPRAVALRIARAAWTVGDIDGAGAVIDALLLADDDDDEAASMAAAVWAARGDSRLSDAVFQAREPKTAEGLAHGVIAAVGAADPESLERRATATPARALPSALVVSLELLSRGLRSSLTPAARSSLGDLVRASEMYTASRAHGPLPEVPAVLAAIVALCLGDPAAAHRVLDDAIRAGHAGPWAQDRLLLWQTWAAIQRERPQEAQASLARARSSGRAMNPRDRMLAAALDVSLARRYGDTAALEPAWTAARDSILRTTFDLFSLLPLGEFTVTAARLGDTELMRGHVDGAFAALGRLGDPPVWSAHLHWAALHAAILRNEPSGVTPHARALLAAAPRFTTAARMAQAGRVWTDALKGVVDADAVESAARGLDEVGLAWDGARLASYAAGRIDDRRAIGRLLACARHLHPRERAEVTEPENGASDSSGSGVDDVLSEREREVAILVLQGKTYAEIGEAIFISPRTAEHHIARIRRRLGATSRSDLMAKLRTVVGGSDRHVLDAGSGAA